MSLKTVLYLAIAIGLLTVGHAVGLRGDAAPFGADGVSPERAKYHLIALALTLGAVGFFVGAGLNIWRSLRR